MSQMATPGVYYSQKRDCGLQNIERENMWKNLGNILYFFGFVWSNLSISIVKNI